MYEACLLSTLLYGSESWTTYSTQEICLESFHMASLRRILQIKWQDKITTRHMSWHTQHPFSTLQATSKMDCQCAKNGRWTHPQRHHVWTTQRWQLQKGPLRLHYKDVVKRDLKKTDIDFETWEPIADDRSM